MRRALTLVELLCVLAVIGLLVGLTVPAVQKVREAANRARCLSHLRQIGLAAHHYHGDRDHLPPSRWDCLAGTWHNALLPYLEQENAAVLWSDQPYHHQPDDTRLQRVRVYSCPSRADRGPSQSGDGRGSVPHRPGATGDYAVVIGNGTAGALDHPPPQAALLRTVPGNGPFIHAWGGPCPGRLWVALADLTRGTSNTLLVGEKAVLGPPGEAPDNCVYNADHAETVGRFAGPRFPLGSHFGGPHPAACLFALADGSARAVATTMDPAELGRLATRDQETP